MDAAAEMEPEPDDDAIAFGHVTWGQVHLEMRRIAAALLRGGPAERPLRPTDLVHDALVRLLGAAEPTWSDRSHFLATCVRVMRQVLVDETRRRLARKRRAPGSRITISGIATPDGASSGVDLIDLDAALVELAELSPRRVRIVELRLLAGLSNEEIASVLGVSGRTVDREWRSASAWLRQRLR